LSTGGPVRAVAIGFVKVARNMNTVIELGHFRHAFRHEDAQALSTITSAVSLRLEQLAF
jgi:hypothetical protein